MQVRPCKLLPRAIEFDWLSSIKFSLYPLTREQKNWLGEFSDKKTHPNNTLSRCEAGIKISTRINLANKISGALYPLTREQKNWLGYTLVF